MTLSRAETGPMLPKSLHELNKIKRSQLRRSSLPNHAGTPNAHGHLATVVNNVGDQLFYAQRLWNQAHPNEQVAVLQYWREWIKDFFDKALIEHTQKFARDLLKTIRGYWAPRTGALAIEILEKVRVFEAELENLSVDTSNFH